MDDSKIRLTLICAFRILCFIFLFVIVFLSLYSNIPRSIFENYDDYYVHFLVYSALTYAFGVGWPQHIGKSAVLILVMGFVIELSQITVASRAFEWSDVLANIAGAFMGMALAFVTSASVQMWFKRSRPKYD